MTDMAPPNSPQSHDAAYTLEITKVGWLTWRAVVRDNAGEWIMGQESFSRDGLERAGNSVIRLLRSGHAPEGLLDYFGAVTTEAPLGY